MGRTPLNSPETVHAVVRQLLAAAGVAAPMTPSLFRRIVTTRRVREDLGGGDPAWIGRQVRAIEVELISESTARYTASGLPDQVADSMRSLWLMALEAARGEFAAAQAAAAASVASAAAERDNASALVAMLRAELDDWQKQAREQDVCIGQQREELAQVHRRLAEETDRARRAEAALDQAARASDEARRRHEEELSSVRGEYAGLSRQLLNATDQFRQSLSAAQAAVQPEVNALRRRLAQVTERYERLLEARAAAAMGAPSSNPPAGNAPPAA